MPAFGPNRMFLTPVITKKWSHSISFFITCSVHLQFLYVMNPDIRWELHSPADLRCIQKKASVIALSGTKRRRSGTQYATSARLFRTRIIFEKFFPNRQQNRIPTALTTSILQIRTTHSVPFIGHKYNTIKYHNDASWAGDNHVRSRIF